MRSNITSLRIIDPKSFDVKNAVHDWEHGERRQGRVYSISPEHVPVSIDFTSKFSRMKGHPYITSEHFYDTTLCFGRRNSITLP